MDSLKGYKKMKKDLENKISSTKELTQRIAPRSEIIMDLPRKFEKDSYLIPDRKFSQLFEPQEPDMEIQNEDLRRIRDIREDLHSNLSSMYPSMDLRQELIEPNLDMIPPENSPRDLLKKDKKENSSSERKFQ